MKTIYTGKRVLVTGGTGFLGKQVVRRLAYMGAHVYSVGRAFDLMGHVSWAQIPDGRCDLIVHLAAHVAGISSNRVEPYDFLSINTEISRNIVELALSHSTPIVAAGSVCSYSDDAKLPFNEHNLFDGLPEETNFGYGMAKRHLVTLLDCAHKQYDLPYVCLISGNLYGPGDNFSAVSPHVIPDLIKKVSLSKRMEDGNIQLYGDGRSTRDFLYINDAADAYIAAGEYLLNGQGTNEIINIGSGQEVTILKILSMIGDIYEHRMTIWEGREGNGQQRRLIDTFKAMDLLGWQSTTGLKDGLKKTIEWYEQTREAATSR